MSSLKRLFHWGPLIAIGIVKAVSWSTVHCNSLWWPLTSSFQGFVNSAVFFFLSGSTLYNLFYSLYTGPGYLPLNWKPEKEEDCQFLQFCTVCQGYKAPRSHHCRKCQRCIMKMDHHCPWINHCVGHRNHTHFTTFLLSAVCGCAQASVVITCTLYRALNSNYYYYHHFDDDVPLITLELWEFIICLFSLGLAIGVVFAVGFLLLVQLKAILKNRSAVEDWVMEKAAYRREGTDETFVYPYDLGWRDNIVQVLNWDFEPQGDGISWPTKEGCDQYSFTIEQLEQKKLKRERAIDYIVEQPYRGSWFPVSYGLRVCLRPPFTDEARLPLQPEDIVTVTRWKRHWLYGELKERQNHQLDTSERRAARGWFPRQCCVVFASGVGGVGSIVAESDKKED